MTVKDQILYHRVVIMATWFQSVSVSKWKEGRDEKNLTMTKPASFSPMNGQAWTSHTLDITAANFQLFSSSLSKRRIIWTNSLTTQLDLGSQEFRGALGSKGYYVISTFFFSNLNVSGSSTNKIPQRGPGPVRRAPAAASGRQRWGLQALNSSWYPRAGWSGASPFIDLCLSLPSIGKDDPDCVVRRVK